MYDASKETNVRFLRAAVKLLQEKQLKTELVVAELKRQKQESEEICRQLSDELLVLKRKFFKGGRETANKNALSKNRKNEDNLPHNTPPVEIEDSTDHTLSSEEQLFDLDHDQLDCSCGSHMQPIKGGTEDSIDIRVEERKYILRTSKRQKYRCNECNSFKTAPGPLKSTVSGKFAAEMAVQVVDDKYHRHMPLNRQREQMAEAGLIVDTKTLFNLARHVADQLEEIPKLIRDEVLSQGAVNIDETTFPIISTNSKGYIWALCNRYGVYYQYETTRSGAVAREMLEGYSGKVVCDGYRGYSWINSADMMTLCACWSHVRRKFYDAAHESPETKKVLDKIDELFEVEHDAKDFKDTAKIRKKRSTKIFKAIEIRISRLKNQHLPSSLTGKAIAYFEGLRKPLEEFLYDPVIPLSNNIAERQLRSPVLGRKSFQGFRTINGADVGMICYSIVNTCRLLSINPKAYMMEMLRRKREGQALMTPYQYAKQLRDSIEADQFKQLASLN